MEDISDRACRIIDFVYDYKFKCDESSEGKQKQ